MGFGRYVVVRGLNALLVLLIALMISVILFADLETKELETRVYEQVQNFARGLRGLPPEEAQKRVEEYRQWLIKAYGLDQPLYVRAFRYLWRALLLDFGEARQRYPAYGATADVRSILLTALGRTILLFTTAQLVVIVIGILLGLYAAYRAGSVFDRFLSVFALVTYSMPMYWVGMLMILFFAYDLGIFPSRSWEYIPESVKANPFSLFTWYLWHMALPLITIILVGFGGLAWTVRNIAISTMQEDFVMVAHAKGLSSKDVLYKHVLRAISPPVVTMSAFSLISSFFGAIISEVVFQWPGMGRLYYTALQNSDTPVVMGVTYLSIMLIVITKFLLDIIYGFLDPRIKVSG